jgi:hypothetical protein
MSSSLARLLCITVCVGGACADWSRGSSAFDPADAATVSDAGATDGSGQSPDVALSFAHPVHGLLTAACQSCHAQGQQAGTTLFLLTGDSSADYASVSAFIDVGAPTSSRLLAKMAGRGHGGGTLYATDAPEYQTVLRWIQEGARP